MKLGLFSLCLLVAFCSGSGQDFYFSLNGVRTLNNSLVRMENIGEGDKGLHCVTPRRPCCRVTTQGEWYYPDNSLVSVRASGDNFYRNRNDNGAVILNRRNDAELPNGKYKCHIPRANNEPTMMIVGIYSELAFPTITSQPTSVFNAVPGSSVTFSVRARDGLKYHWVFNRDFFLQDTARHQGAKTNTLRILNVHELDEGLYHCVVEKEQSVRSELATLSVMDPPVIEKEPVNVPDLILGQDVTFTVQASGVELSYEWEFADGSPLQMNPDYIGVNTPNFTIRRLMREDVDFYRCAVSNPAGSTYSLFINITLLEPPQIVVQPESMFDLELSQNVTFSLLATGKNLSYQWQYSDGSPLPTSTEYDGVDTPTFTIWGVRIEHMRAYRCVVSNRAGAVYSNSVNISITSVLQVSSLNVDINISSVLLTWTPTAQPGMIPTFKVLYYHLSFPEREVTVDVEEPAYLAEGLLPRGRYRFEVRQVTSIGVSRAASVDVRLTENIPAVENINVTLVDSTVLLVAWDLLPPLPGWNLSFYEVHFTTTLTNHTPSRPSHTHTVRTIDGYESSVVSNRDVMSVDGGSVEVVIEVSGMLDVGLEGVGVLEGEKTTKKTTLTSEKKTFQIILGPTDYCITWTDEKTADIRRDIRAALARAISTYCHCNFTADSIAPGGFSCRQSSSFVVYRSSIAGLDAERAIMYLERWVRTGTASMLVRSFFWDLQDIRDCSVRISSMDEPECLVNEQGSPPQTLLTNDPAVINCVRRCVGSSEAGSLCGIDP